MSKTKSYLNSRSLPPSCYSGGTQALNRQNCSRPSEVWRVLLPEIGFSTTLQSKQQCSFSVQTVADSDTMWKLQAQYHELYVSMETQIRMKSASYRRAERHILSYPICLKTRLGKSKTGPCLVLTIKYKSRPTSYNNEGE